MLHLVRHGQSTWNVEGRLQGQVMDVPLTDVGRRQAEDAATALAVTLAGRPVVWSSDQLRALDTAGVIGERLGVPVLATELLREQSLGALEGCLAGSLRPEPVPPGVDISEVSWHGSETIAHVWQRAARVLDLAWRAAGDADAEVVLVSHGTFLQVLDAVLGGRSHREVDWDRMPANGSVEARCWPAWLRPPSAPTPGGQPPVPSDA